MKIFFYKFFFILILLVNKNILLAKTNNKILLKVENEIITNYEVKDKILRTLYLTNQEINQDNIDKLKKRSLDSIIQLKLKKIELSKFNLNLDQIQLTNYLNKISNNNILGFQESFIKNKLSYDLFLDEVKTELKWKKLIYKIYSKKISLNEDSLNDELEEIIKNNKKIEEVNISEIEIIINENFDKTNIIEIQNDIKKIGFGNAALKYSISPSASQKGNLGWLNVKTLSNQIYDVVNKMQPGEISEPIKKQNTILFLKINDKRVSETNKLSVSLLKKNLLNQKKNELFNLYSQSHISKLKNSILIEYR